MKGVWLMTWFALLGGYAAAADADLEPFRLDDAVWVKDAGDRMARCAGTYRGAADVMRERGREQAASYAESVGTGALFAAYLLLTSSAAVEGKVLDDVDTNVHIQALAWGAKRNFVMMDKDGDPALSEVLRGCTQTSALQSAILRGSMATPAAADARPAD